MTKTAYYMTQGCGTTQEKELNPELTVPNSSLYAFTPDIGDSQGCSAQPHLPATAAASTTTAA